MSIEATPRPRAMCARAHRQRGSLLLEVMAVAALALVLAVWASHEWATRVRLLQAQSLAAWMETARDAVQAYLERESAAVSGDPDSAPSGDDLLVVPAWADLQAGGFLPAGWGLRGPLGQALVATAWRSGDCSAGACQWRALVHTAAALQDSRGQLDEALIAQWLLASAGRGLVAWPHRPGVFSGRGEEVPLPPTGQVTPGAVALLAQVPGPSGQGSDGGATAEADFLRVRDARDPDFQGSLSVQGVVRSAQRLVAGESVVLETGWQPGTACGVEGALGREQSYPGVLVCRQGAWRMAARGSGGGYMQNSRRGCKNAAGGFTGNLYTGGCNCPAGFSAQQVAESGLASSQDGLTAGYVCLPPA